MGQDGPVCRCAPAPQTFRTYWVFYLTLVLHVHCRPAPRPCPWGLTYAPRSPYSAPATAAGTTVTCLLVVGQLLTIANIGDSEAWMDTGSTPVCLIHSHRLQENKAERERLKAANVEIAQLGFHLQGPARGSEIGVGPVRLWPGGLCVSRSVGDLDSGAEVLPLPHIKQVRLPNEGMPGRRGAVPMLRRERERAAL